jgi:hypothetical protein
MTDITAEMAKNTASNTASDLKVPGEIMALDRRYGQIGILAVAAAVRYQGGGKNPAYAPCSSQWRDRMADVAA